MMKILFLVVLTVVVTVVVSFDVAGKGTAKGKFQYNGNQCKWHEGRETRSIRSLNIQCGGKNKFSTKYEGDPHKCNWYKDGNQVAYYECLVSALIKANFDENSPSQISCSKKNCGDVVFKKASSRLLRLMKKTVDIEEELIEIAEPNWSEFDIINAFN